MKYLLTIWLLTLVWLVFKLVRAYLAYRRFERHKAYFDKLVIDASKNPNPQSREFYTDQMAAALDGMRRERR